MLWEMGFLGKVLFPILQNEIALLKLLTAARVLITLGPVIRKLFTDLKQRKENESHSLPQAEEHP